MKDYYEILGVGKTATAEEIKKSFRILAFKHHPDYGGDPEKFKKLYQAYDTLSDKNKREEYDALGIEAYENKTEQKKWV